MELLADQRSEHSAQAGYTLVALSLEEIRPDRIIGSVKLHAKTTSWSRCCEPVRMATAASGRRSGRGRSPGPPSGIGRLRPFTCQAARAPRIDVGIPRLTVWRAARVSDLALRRPGGVGRSCWLRPAWALPGRLTHRLAISLFASVVSSACRSGGWRRCGADLHCVHRLGCLSFNCRSMPVAPESPSVSPLRYQVAASDGSALGPVTFIRASSCGS